MELGMRIRCEEESKVSYGPAAPRELLAWLEAGKVQGPLVIEAELPPLASPDGESVAYVTYEPRPMKTRPDLQFWGGTTIWVVPASAGATPRAVTQKSQHEVYDLK
jgi:hypothetical protein